MPLANKNGPETIDFLVIPSRNKTAMPPKTKPAAMIQSMSGNKRKYQSSQALPTTIRVTGKPAFLMKPLRAWRTGFFTSPRGGDVDGDAVGIGELKLAVLAFGEQFEPDLAFGAAGFG